MILFLLACGNGEDSNKAPDSAGPDPLSWDVAADGPYHVGYRVWAWTYNTGLRERTINVHVWYPTEDTGGVPPTYMIGTPDADSFTDATLAPSAYGDQYPVHVYSHGYMGFAASSADLMRYYASHGWIAIAPDHTDNTLLDTTEPLPARHYYERPMDIPQSIAAVEADSILAGKLDLSRVLLSGHSFGSYTTWSVGGATFDVARITERCNDGSIADCSADDLAVFSTDLSDDRVVATLPMAGTLSTDWFGETGHRTIQGPVFFMSGTEDQVGQDTQWDLIDQIDFTWIDVEGACHQTFAMGGCLVLEKEEGYAIVNTYGLAFGRANILGDTSVSGILDGSVVVSDKVSFQRKVE